MAVGPCTVIRARGPDGGLGVVGGEAHLRSGAWMAKPAGCLTGTGGIRRRHWQTEAKAGKMADAMAAWLLSPPCCPMDEVSAAHRSFQVA